MLLYPDCSLYIISKWRPDTQRFNFFFKTENPPSGFPFTSHIRLKTLSSFHWDIALRSLTSGRNKQAFFLSLFFFSAQVSKHPQLPSVLSGLSSRMSLKDK